MTVLRVGLTQPLGPASPRPLPLLHGDGPAVVLGGHDAFAGPLRPAADKLYGPRGARLLGADGPLWVADTGHHRLLGWRRRPTVDGAPADLVIGQASFAAEGRNGGRDGAAAHTVNMPTGVSTFGAHGLMVADSWNNRVLIWHEYPERDNTPADLVLGQADFTGMAPNRDRGAPAADTMHWPFQALVHEGRLYVADGGNRRVLVWRTVPTRNGQPADFALGQPSLDERSDNGGGQARAGTFRWPHDLAVLADKLLVADAGDNRVLVYAGMPEAGAVADLVLGQHGFDAVDHNHGRYLPTAAALSMPYGIAAARDRLCVADTANSRLLGFALPLHSGMAASRLTGQPDFDSKGDNRWQLPVRDSLCWPYGLSACGDLLVVADTGNHRVLLWPLDVATPEGTHG